MDKRYNISLDCAMESSHQHPDQPTEPAVVIVGNVVTPTGSLPDGAIAIDGNGRISWVGPAKHAPRAAREFDYRGRWVLPGGVDAHVHSGSHAVWTEGSSRLTALAATGGVTTVIDMPYDDPEPVVSILDVSRKIQRIESEAHVDVGLFGTVPKGMGAGNIVDLGAAGVCGIKISTYETHPIRFPSIPDHQITTVLLAASAAGLPVAVHAENDSIVRHLIDELKGSRRLDPLAHAHSRPPVTETTAVASLLELAWAVTGRLHLVHLSSPRSVELLSRHRAEGSRVSCETCIHYLVLDESDLERHGGFAKCNPPLRSSADQQGLWRQLLAGEIDFVTSDHAPWPDALKSSPDIFENKSGLPGVHLLVPLLFSSGVMDRGLAIEEFVRLTSSSPAQAYGLYPRKGALAVGSDGDVVVIDQSEEWVIEPGLHDFATRTPYDGMPVRGKVAATFLRGGLVFDGKRVCGTPSGTFVRPSVAEEGHL